MGSCVSGISKAPATPNKVVPITNDSPVTNITSPSKHKRIKEYISLPTFELNQSSASEINANYVRIVQRTWKLISSEQIVSLETIYSLIDYKGEHAVELSTPNLLSPNNKELSTPHTIHELNTPHNSQEIPLSDRNPIERNNTQAMTQRNSQELPLSDRNPVEKNNENKGDDFLPLCKRNTLTVKIIDQEGHISSPKSLVPHTPSCNQKTTFTNYVVPLLELDGVNRPRMPTFSMMKNTPRLSINVNAPKLTRFYDIFFSRFFTISHDAKMFFSTTGRSINAKSQFLSKMCTIVYHIDSIITRLEKYKEYPKAYPFLNKSLFKKIGESILYSVNIYFQEFYFGEHTDDLNRKLRSKLMDAWRSVYSFFTIHYVDLIFAPSEYTDDN